MSRKAPVCHLHLRFYRFTDPWPTRNSVHKMTQDPARHCDSVWRASNFRKVSHLVQLSLVVGQQEFMFFSVFVWRMLIAENIMSCWHLCKLCNRIHMNKLASFQPWTYTEMNPNANEVQVACMHPINHSSKLWDGLAKPLGQAVLHQTPFPGGQAWNWLFLPQGNYGGLGCRVQMIRGSENCHFW